MPDARIAYRPFDEQLAFFRRKVNVPSAAWDDIERGDHAHGFMVAGATRATLLDDLRGAVERAISGGRGFQAFRDEFEAAVERNEWRGWTGEGTAAGRAWRARTIYETNLRQSYNAGRYAQLTSPAMIEARPYWEYRHGERGRSRTPRPQHLAWSGTILLHSDPWWRTHYPQNGWGCNCGVRALSAADLRRRGLTVGAAPTSVDDVDGVDEGFDYNVGESARAMPAAASLGERIMRMPPAWREVALQDAQQRSVEWSGEWPALLDRVAAESAAGARRPRGYAQPLGFLRPDVAAVLPVQPSTALLGAVDTQVYHALRDVKGDAQAALRDALRELPARMAAEDTVTLWDRGLPGQRNTTPALVYAWPLQDGRWVRAVVHVESAAGDRAMRHAGMRGNWLRTIGLVERYNLIEAKKYVLLRGEV